MEWNEFFDAQAGRAVRSVLLQTLELRGHVFHVIAGNLVLRI